jgi:hypothetical protein
MPVVSSDKVGTSKAFVSVKSNAPESGGCVQYYRNADILALASDEHILESLISSPLLIESLLF